MRSTCASPKSLCPNTRPKLIALAIRRCSAGHPFERHAEHLGGRAQVDVLAGAKRVEKRRILREVRQDPQLDLRVVGGDQEVPRRRDERLADAPADLVRMGMFWRFGSLDDRRPVAATAWLNEVWSRPVRRVHERRQRVDVRALELGERAVLDDLRRHRVQRRQLLERVGVGRGAGLGLAHHRQAQLPEQHVGQLFVRVDVERPTGDGVDLRFQRRQRRTDLMADLAQLADVEQDADQRNAIRVEARQQGVRSKDYGSNLDVSHKGKVSKTGRDYGTSDRARFGELFARLYHLRAQEKALIGIPEYADELRALRDPRGEYADILVELGRRPEGADYPVGESPEGTAATLLA